VDNSFVGWSGGLFSDPNETMRLLYRWLELPDAPFDPQHLTVTPHESDSYYRWKYPHNMHETICPPAPHAISPRIEQEILKNFKWFFDLFYADLSSQAATKPKPGLLNPKNVLNRLGIHN
jgi:sulfotransferase